MTQIESTAISDRRVYAQSSKPSDNRDGILWVDTSTSKRTTYVYSQGTNAWERVSQDEPVRVVDETGDFDPGVTTLTVGNIEVNNGSAGLLNAETVSRAADDKTGSGANGGLIINPNYNIDKIDVEVSANTSSFSDLVVEQHSDGTEIARKSGPWTGGDTTTIDCGQLLQTGTEYRVLGRNGGSSFDLGNAGGASVSISGTRLDIVNGYAAGSTNSDPYVIGSVGTPSKTTGSIRAEWPQPSDNESWDLATWQRTLNNESVTIDVENGSGTKEFTDITQNFDISTIGTSKNVYLRANIDRGSTSNNPTIDYLARRFER